MAEMQISFSNEVALNHSSLLLDLSREVESYRLNEKLRSAIVFLWKQPETQATILRRNEFQLNDRLVSH